MDQPLPYLVPNRLPNPVRSAAFGRSFWFTYAANSLMMIGVAMLFRYADLVKVLGGTELELGLIVGSGMVGSLLMRAAQGVGIDSLGPRQVWIWSTVGFIAACLGHLAIDSLEGPWIFALRILLQTSTAGFFGASITYVSSGAPNGRIAEVIGLLGTSGFLGMVVGTSLGDLLVGDAGVDRLHVDRLFVAAAIAGTLALVLAAMATWGQPRPVRRKRLPLLWLLRRYHPGPILLVGVAMGVGLALPSTFLRPFAAQLGIPGIAVFFGVYPPIAFLARLLMRRWPDRVGVRPTILLGLASLALSMLAFLLVRAQWHLMVPAIFLGTAHAFLFPSLLAGGSAAFPVRYRGLATTLVLAMFDLGVLVGSPMVGGLLHTAAALNLPAYPTMFLAVSILMTVVAVVYAMLTRGSRQMPDRPGVAAYRRKIRRGPRRGKQEHQAVPQR